MNIRRLNNSGIEMMESFLDSLTTDDPQPYPESLLTDNEHSVSAGIDAELEHRHFGSRFELAEYLTTQLGTLDFQDSAKERGVWSWIALYYFPLICPKKHKEWKPGERARWIPVPDDFQKYYRHLIAGPYRIYQFYREDPRIAMSLLCNPPGSPGELPEQLASRQEILTNRSLIETATRLYIDPESQGFKRGAGGRGPGSPRRFALVTLQFDLTWDLYSMTTDQVLDMLPHEFNRFRE